MTLKIQDLIDALQRASTLEGKYDFREARAELKDCMKILADEDNRLRLKQEGRWV